MLLLAIRFLLELVGLGAFAFVGATVPSEPVLRVVFGIGTPLALAVVWALVAAPKADNPLPLRARSLLGSALLVGVGLTLVLAGQPAWGIGFAIAVVVDQALIVLLGLDESATTIEALATKGSI